MNSIPAGTPLFLVHTDLGDGRVTVSQFTSPQHRLESLRARAQAYFLGTEVPLPRGSTDESAALATLLGFFLMLTNGSVVLSESVSRGRHVPTIETSAMPENEPMSV